jgi:hypothetical protein
MTPAWANDHVKAISDLLCSLVRRLCTEDDNKMAKKHSKPTTDSSKNSKKKDSSVEEFKIIRAMIPCISPEERVKNLQLGVDGLTDQHFSTLLLGGNLVYYYLYRRCIVSSADSVLKQWEFPSLEIICCNQCSEKMIIMMMKRLKNS